MCCRPPAGARYPLRQLLFAVSRARAAGRHPPGAQLWAVRATELSTPFAVGRLLCQRPASCSGSDDLLCCWCAGATRSLAQTVCRPALLSLPAPQLLLEDELLTAGVRTEAPLRNAPGSGKSSLLKALGNREVPIPEHVDTYFLDRSAHMQRAHQAAVYVFSSCCVYSQTAYTHTHASAPPVLTDRHLPTLNAAPAAPGQPARSLARGPHTRRRAAAGRRPPAT
jgi:hypothetical protein